MLLLNAQNLTNLNLLIRTNDFIKEYNSLDNNIKNIIINSDIIKLLKKQFSYNNEIFNDSKNEVNILINRLLNSIYKLNCVYKEMFEKSIVLGKLNTDVEMYHNEIINNNDISKYLLDYININYSDLLNNFNNYKWNSINNEHIIIDAN